MQLKAAWRAALTLFAMAIISDTAVACTRSRVTPPPIIWGYKQDHRLPTPNVWLGIPVDIPLSPVAPTECIVGLGLGDTVNPLTLTSLDVISAHMTVTNIATTTLMDLPAFNFLRNSALDVPLTVGNNPPILGQPIFPGATWFGFSAQVNPFPPPNLGPNEEFALWFELSMSDADLLILEKDIFRGQFAAGSTELGHEVVYFSAANSIINVPEPGTLALLGLAWFALLARALPSLRRPAR